MLTNLHLIVSSLVLASAYALVGIGYNLAYSTLRVINFAQGQIYMMGALIFATVAATGAPLVLAVFCGVAAGALIGMAVERFVITPIMRQGFSHGNTQAALLGTVAAGIVLTEVANRAWGSRELPAVALFGSGTVHIGSLTVGIDSLTVIGGAALCMLGVWMLLYRTSVGLQMRAVFADPSVTMLQGINFRTVTSISFLVGGVITALAGILVSPLTSVTTSSGVQLSIQGILATLVGGLGRMWGVVPAAIAMGLCQSFVSYYITNQYADLVTYAAIFVALVGPHWVRAMMGRGPSWWPIRRQRAVATV
jgi:branched-chain amino acid transport system permease protein